LPDFFDVLKRRIEDEPRFKQRDIKLEHYVVSTGLSQMIRGSAIHEHVDGVWGCELLGVTAPPHFKLKPEVTPTPDPDAPLTSIAYAIDNTTKTRAIFEINKGVNRHPQIDVNSLMPHEARRVPFDHMIYIADGPSDVPVFSVVKQYGGKTFAVYAPESQTPKDFRQAEELQNQGRVHAFGPADYRRGTHTYLCITTWAEQIAEKIAKRWQTALGDTLGTVPTHILPAEGEIAQAEAEPVEGLADGSANMESERDGLENTDDGSVSV